MRDGWKNAARVREAAAHLVKPKKKKKPTPRELYVEYYDLKDRTQALRGYPNAFTHLLGRLQLHTGAGGRSWSRSLSNYTNQPLRKILALTVYK